MLNYTQMKKNNYVQFACELFCTAGHCTVIFCICWIYSNEANYGIIKGGMEDQIVILFCLFSISMSGPPISVSPHIWHSLTDLLITKQEPDGLRAASHISVPAWHICTGQAQVWAVKSFMKLCLLEQPQCYSKATKVCGLLSTSEGSHWLALWILQHKIRPRPERQEWNSAKWIPLSPDRLKLSHDVGLRTRSFKVMIWKRNQCCKPSLLMLLATDDRHATEGELIHFTSLRYRFHHCGDGSGGTLHAMHA